LNKVQYPADRDVFKVTWFYTKFKKVTESKIPRPGPKTKAHQRGLKRRHKGRKDRQQYWGGRGRRRGRGEGGRSFGKTNLVV
jgi:hypothetical protein